MTVTNHAIEAVDHCLRVVGGAGLTRALPLERLYRDVRAGLSHPPSDDEALTALAQETLQRIHSQSLSA